MSLYLCVDCAVVYDCPSGIGLTCPRCGKSLELREQGEEGVATLGEVAGWAMHGEPPRRRRLWSVE